MNKAFYLKLYLSTFAVFLLLDFLWLTFIAKDYYTSQIGFLLSPQPNILAAGIFYALFIVGLLYFVVIPAVKVKNLSTIQTGLSGGFFGLITYATYDLTNLATLANWPVQLVIVDMLWGFFLAGMVTALSYKIAKRLV